MKILAIEKEVPGADWSTISKELMAQEALAVYRMYLAEQLREHYFNEENCAVLVLECETKTHAQALLGELPLVEQNLITFEIMELHPYTGYDRIIQAMK
ncbi:hypothetical protein [Polluticoccus soli]|uniref:hypothetical protein n=1 Tax=Polluticoccus soli TaxID=3034150 RepID=UPI0023E2D091|nr:hypothetical protein [Flavipsychrobacter sp. JY13-12]